MKTEKRPRWPNWLNGLIVVLVVLLAAAMAGAAYFYAQAPAANTREYELLKTCLSVIAVALVGGLATFAFSVVQKERDRRYDDDKRDLEEQMNARRSRDTAVSELLNDTLTHYLAVKRIRRELEAVTRKAGSDQGNDTGSVGNSNSTAAEKLGAAATDASAVAATITLEEYDRYMRELNHHQLVFERLKKAAPLLDARLPHLEDQRTDGTYPDSLEGVFGEVEEFLNDVVDEYQRSRHVVAQSGELSLVDLTASSAGRKRRPSGEVKRALRDFIYDTSVFRRESRDVDRVVRRLESALLEKPDFTGAS